MISTDELREKYATRRGPMVSSRGWTPAGSKDVLRLCDVADEALTIIQAIVNDLPTRRDWLDPAVEARARAILKEHQEEKDSI